MTTTRKKISDQTKTEIIEALARGERAVDVAAKYGLGASTICTIKARNKRFLQAATGTKNPATRETDAILVPNPEYLRLTQENANLKRVLVTLLAPGALVI